MNRPVLIHGVLLALALVTAYFVWTRDTTTREDEIPILRLRGGLDRIVYSAPDRVVEVDRRRDKGGSYHWVKVETVTEKPAPKPPAPPASAPAETPEKKDDKKAPEKAPDKKAPDKKAPDDKKAEGKKDEKKPEEKKPDKPKPPEKPKMIKVTKTRQFKGNKSADEMVKALSNLAAIRTLGTVDKDKLKAFGLEESKKTLTLISGSSPRTFIIGGNTYGNQDIYVQDKQDKRVYVVRPRNLQDLQYAEFRLIDRELHSFAPSDVERAVLVAGKRRKVLVQKSRRDPAKAFWVDADAPEKKKDFYRNFMGKLLRLQAMEYVPVKEQKKGLSEVLRVEYKVASGKGGFLRLYSAAPPPVLPGAKPPTPPPSGKEYYGISSNTRAQVKVNARLVDEVVRDVDNLMKD
jgi:hypothetical protein